MTTPPFNAPYLSLQREVEPNNNRCINTSIQLTTSLVALWNLQNKKSRESLVHNFMPVNGD